jgi:serine/threonine protein phosphatase 1
VTLMGNHEWMLLDFIAEDRKLHPSIWIQNGGMNTIESYADGHTPPEWWDESVPERHKRFYASLKLWHRDQRGIYVHAGLRPGQRPENADAEERESEDGCLWIREPFINSDYAWKRVVVFGHTPQHVRGRGSKEPVWQPLNRPEKIGIDTGCAYGGPLTAVVLPQREFLSSDD